MKISEIVAELMKDQSFYEVRFSSLQCDCVIHSHIVIDQSHVTDQSFLMIVCIS